MHGMLRLGAARRIFGLFAVTVTAVLASSAVTLATPLTASADVINNVDNKRICESFGGFCLGADTLSINTAVVERDACCGGRLFDAVATNETFEGFPIWHLRFSGDHSLCVGVAANNVDVIIRDCTGYGTAWARDHNAKETSNLLRNRWISRPVTQANNTKEFLSGDNRSGHQYHVHPAGTTGAEQQFDFINPPS